MLCKPNLLLLPFHTPTWSRTNYIEYVPQQLPQQLLERTSHSPLNMLQRNHLHTIDTCTSHYYYLEWPFGMLLS